MNIFDLYVQTIKPVYVKPCLSQVNVRQNVSATSRNVGWISQIAMIGHYLEIISQIILCYKK